LTKHRTTVLHRHGAIGSRKGNVLFALVLTFALTAIGFGQNLKNSGQIQNQGTIRVKNSAVGLPANVDGVFEFFGADQTVPAKAYKDLILSGSGNKNTSGGNLSVANTLTIYPAVTLNIESGRSLILIGDLDEQGYLSGTITKTANLSGSTTSSNFGNIGATISWVGNAPGTTTVTRTSGVSSSGNGNQSIKRYYDVAPTFSGGLNSTLVFQYADVELNGHNPATLELWRSPDGGATWRRQGGTVNIAQRTITKNGILNFSRWTAADSAHPLGPTAYEGVASAIALTQGNNQSQANNTVLANPFVVTVTDFYGNPIPGVVVTFSISLTPNSASGQALSVVTDTTDAAGQASTVLTLGNQAGTYQVEATSTGLSGSPITFTAIATGGSASNVVQISGNGQSGVVMTTLSQPMVVKVTNSSGNAVAGVGVTFAVASKPPGSTGDSLTVVNAASNVNGEASTFLRLGNLVGDYVVTATSPGLTGSPISFTATATAGPAAILTMTSGNNQTARVDTFLNPFVVKITDQYGNGRAGAGVSFAVSSKPPGATGDSLTVTNATTDSLGRAATTFRLGTKAGSYLITATASGLTNSPLTFTATATPAAARFMAEVTGNNQTGTVATSLNPFVVQVTDQYANGKPGVPVSFAILNKPSGSVGDSLTVASVTTDSSGRAATTLILGTKAGTYLVGATSPALADTLTFAATATPGAATTIVLTSGNNQVQQVTSTLAPFVVTTRDQYGNSKPGINVAFTVTEKPAGTSEDTLTVLNATTNSAGTASAVLRFGTKVGNYSVTAASTGLVGSPIVFSARAVAGPAALVISTSGDNQTGIVNTDLTTPFVVRVTDVYQNPVENATVRFAILGTPIGSQGQRLTDTLVSTNSDGQASTFLKLGNKSGRYTVIATSANLFFTPIFIANAVPEGAAAFVLTSGNNQRTAINTQLPNPFVVTAADGHGNPVSGIGVTFVISSVPLGSSGASLSLATTTTDTNGQASTVLRLGSKVGDYLVTAIANGLVGSPLTFRASATAGAAVSVALAAGDGQVGVVGTALSPMSVRVLDMGGNAVRDTRVDFRITSVPDGALGQSLSVQSAATDSLGTASTTLTLGNRVGSYVVEASSVGLTGSPVTFTSTATAGGSNIISLASGNNQSAQVNTLLPNPLVVTVKDANNNPVSGVSVAFAIVNKPSGTSGDSLTISTAVTDSTGSASTRLRLGNKLGTYRVAATSSGIVGSPVVFTATATVGGAATISLQQGNNQQSAINTMLPQPLVVTITDASNNPVSGVSVAFAIDSVPNGAQGQNLSVSEIVTDSLGQAATSLTLGDKVGVYKVTATSAGLTGSPVTFYATAFVGPASSIAVAAGDRQRTGIFTRLPNAFVVSVKDSGGNAVAGVPVHFAISSVPSGAAGQSLSVADTATDSNGQASTVLTLGNRVGDYIVTASSSGLAGSPVSFVATATPGSAATIVLAGGNNQQAPINTSLPVPLRVSVSDAGGNALPGQRVTFAFASVPSNASGQSLSVVDVQTDSNGAASTVLTLGDKIGTYVVTATSARLNGSPVVFTGRATVGAAVAVIEVSGSNQIRPVLASLDRPFVARVVDAGSNPVPGVQVQFALVSVPPGATGQQLSVSSAPTDTLGQVSTVLTLGSREGLYVVRASSGNLKDTTFSVLAFLGDATHDNASNIADLTAIVDHILGKRVLTGADAQRVDLDTNGVVDIRDAILYNNNLLDGVWEYTLTNILTSPSPASSATTASSGSTAKITANVSSVFEITPNGLRLNLKNDVPIRGLQVYMKLRSPVTLDKPDVVFGRARGMNVAVKSQGREVRTVLYNLENNPLMPDSGSTILRFPITLTDVTEIESTLVIASVDTNVAMVATASKTVNTTYPVTYLLEQNYPNPFNAGTIIRYEIPDVPGRLVKVALQVYNILGQKVKTLVRGEQPAGRYEVGWDATDDFGTKVASGTYIYRLIANDVMVAKKMVLIK
jgi:adhesin/invasin